MLKLTRDKLVLFHSFVGRGGVGEQWSRVAETDETRVFNTAAPKLPDWKLLLEGMVVPFSETEAGSLFVFIILSLITC